MKELTSSERVISAIELQEVDRTPVVPQLTYAAGYFIRMKIDEALTDFVKQKEALISSWKLGGYDGIYAGWEGSFVLIIDGLGGILRTYPDMPPSIEKPLITNREDLESLPKLDPTSHGRIPLNLRLIQSLKKEVKGVPIFSYIPSPFTLASVLLGITEFMISLMRDKMKILEDLLQFAYQTTLIFAKAKIKAGVDMLTIADPSGSSDMVSPTLFEKYSFPLLKNLIVELKKSKIKVGLHICGQTKPILAKLAEINADYLELDAKVDLAEAQKTLDGKVCLFGNISSTDLTVKTAKDIKRQCLELIKGMKPGFILSSGCEVAYSTPLENIQAMAESTKEFKKTQY